MKDAPASAGTPGVASGADIDTGQERVQRDLWQCAYWHSSSLPGVPEKRWPFPEKRIAAGTATP